MNRMNRIKITCCLFGGWLMASGCSTTGTGDHGKADPETVMITYHVKSGKDSELQAALASAWQIYLTEHLVYAEPHVVVWAPEDGDKTRFVEIFTWVSHATPEHAPDAVKKIWEQEQSLCEARKGHTAIEGGEVELVGGR
jgi:hypothetical protein